MYPDCFQGIGQFPGEYHITLKDDATPVIHPPRRVPESLKQPLKEELERMTTLGVIKKVDGPTDWVSSLVYVTKPNGDLRICLDPKDLNANIKREHHYTPTMDDVLDRLGQAKVFSILDARSGYWNVKLDPKSQLLTTFNTPYGRYCFTRLPFGIVSAQDVFQKKVDQTYDGLPGVVGIADDIVVFGKDNKEHDVNLINMMERTRDIGPGLNFDKCHIRESRIKFYGNYLTGEGLKPDPDKIAAITNMKPPQSLQELQTLLGMANYLGRFTKSLATITSPLRQLLKKDVPFQWQPEHNKAFNDLKAAITSSETLAYFNPKKDIVIQTDASKQGLGSTLFQDGRPVAYASKTLTETEQNYANIEREMLAIVFALERFHHYCYGREVTIESDHKPLESITKKKLTTAPPRLMRMLLRIQKYDFKVKYVPGKDIPVADTLSRAPIPGQGIKDMDIQVHELVNVSHNRLQQIRDLLPNDKQLDALGQVVRRGWPDRRHQCPLLVQDFWNYRDEISFYDGLLLKGDRVIIPKAMQPEVLDSIHKGHQGIEKCRLRARQAVFWCNMNQDIERLVKNCSTCQECQKSQPKEPLIPVEAKHVWDILGTDIFMWNNENHLILVDYYSSFPIARRLKNITAESTINTIKSVMSEYGVPEKLISDSGSQYTSQEFRNFAKEYDFQHSMSSPYHHQANGKAERHIDTFKRTLMKALTTHKDLDMALLCIRTTPLGNGLPSPAKRMFERQLKSNLPMVNLRNKDDSFTHKMQKRRDYTKAHYDARTRELTDLTRGQDVRVQNPHTERWEAARVVAETGQPRQYLVKTHNGAEYRRNRRFIRTTSEDLSKTPIDADEEIQPYQRPIIADDRSTTVPDASNPPATTHTPASNMVPSTDPGSHYPVDNPPAPAIQYTTRSGRLVKPPVKLTLSINRRR